MKLILAFFFLALSNAFGVDEINAWGYGAQLHDLLRAIASFTGNTSDVIIKIALVIGIFLTVIKSATSGTAYAHVMLIKTIVIGVVLSNLFWIQRGEYIVRDVTNNFVSPTVLNLPYGVGYSVSLLSTFEKQLGSNFEAAFSTPNSITYQKAGLGFMMSAHLGMDSITATDPTLTQTFTEYLDNCLLNSAAMGNLNINTIQTSTDLMSALAVNEAWLTPVYGSANYSQGQVVQCTDAWNDIKSRVPADANQAVNYFSKSFGQLSATDVSSKLGDVATTLFGNAAISSTAYINQMTMMNMFDSGLRAVAASTASDLSSVASATAISNATTKSTYVQTGIAMKHKLPMLKAVLVMMTVAILPIMALFSIMTSNLNGIVQMFKLMLAFMMWTPLIIILNNLTYSFLESTVGNVTMNSLPTMLNRGLISEQAGEYLAFLGWASTLISGFSMLLVGGSVTSFATAMSATSLAAGIGAGATTQATGNVSLGDRRIMNESIANSNRFGSNVYGQDTAAQGNGWSMKYQDGIMQSKDNTEVSSSYTANGDTIKATFGKNGDLVKGSIDGLSLGEYKYGRSEEVSKMAKEAKQLKDTYTAAQSIDIADKMAAAKTRSEKEAVATSFGMNLEKAETIQKNVESAVAKANVKNTTNSDRKDHTDTAEGKTSTEFKADVGGGFKVGETGVGFHQSASATGTKANKDAHTQATSNDQRAEEQARYQEARLNAVKTAFSSNSSLRHDTEKSFQSTLQKEHNETNAEQYKRAQEYSKIDSIEKSLANKENKALSFEQNLDTRVLDTIMKNHGDSDVDKQKHRLHDIQKEEVLPGGKHTYREEIIATAEAEAEKLGFGKKDLEQIRSELDSLDGKIQSGGANVKGKFEVAASKVVADLNSTNPSNSGLNSSFGAGATGLSQQFAGDKTIFGAVDSANVDNLNKSVYSGGEALGNGVDTGLSNTTMGIQVRQIADGIENAATVANDAMHPGGTITASDRAQPGSWINNLPSSQMSSATRAELMKTAIKSSKVVGKNEETY